MKTHIDLRSTVGQKSWPQRGIAALAVLAAAVVIAIMVLQAARPGIQAIPTGPAAQTARPATFNPNNPINGTGSAYDGRDYSSPHPQAADPNNPINGTGSAYDGRDYSSTHPGNDVQKD